MKGWKEFKLDDVFYFYNGKAIKTKEVGQYPIYGSNGKIGYTDKYKFEKSIIIGRVGAYCGAVFYEDNKFWASDNTIVVNEKDGFNIEFLSYLLSLLNLNWFAGGSAQPLLTHGWLKPIKVTIPNYFTQRKIAKILSTYDDLIENNLKRIKLLEEKAQIEFNKWYAENKDFEEVNLGSLIEHEIGGGWGAEEPSEEFSEPAYVIRGTDINELPNGKIEKVPFRYHKKSNLASRKLQDGDIIFEVSGGSSNEGVAKTLLITTELLNQFDNAVMPASFCKLARPVDKKYAHFLFIFLRFLRHIKGTEVFEIRSASNIVNYNWSAFLKYQQVKKPSDKELEMLNKIVEPIYKQIYNLGKQNQLLKEARDILLPRLMTGVIDIEKIKI